MQEEKKPWGKTLEQQQQHKQPMTNSIRHSRLHRSCKNSTSQQILSVRVCVGTRECARICPGRVKALHLWPLIQFNQFALQIAHKQNGTQSDEKATMTEKNKRLKSNRTWKNRFLQLLQWLFRHAESWEFVTNNTNAARAVSVQSKWTPVAVTAPDIDILLQSQPGCSVQRHQGGQWHRGWLGEQPERGPTAGRRSSSTNFQLLSVLLPQKNTTLALECWANRTNGWTPIKGGLKGAEGALISFANQSFVFPLTPRCLCNSPTPCGFSWKWLIRGSLVQTEWGEGPQREKPGRKIW